MGPRTLERAAEGFTRQAGSKPDDGIGPASQPSPAMIVGSISDVVEVIDPRGVITYSNLSHLQQQALGLDAVLGRQCHLVYDRVCSSCAECPLDEVLTSGRRLTQECQVLIKAGRRRWVRQHLYPIINDKGVVSGVLRMVFDITREKRDQSKAARYVDSLEQSLHNRGRPRPHALPQTLSPREQEVLSYMADGLSNQEIARLLGISPNTVKTHVVHIFNKLGVKDRTQAAVNATKLDLI